MGDAQISFLVFLYNKAIHNNIIMYIVFQYFIFSSFFPFFSYLCVPFSLLCFALLDLVSSCILFVGHC